MTEYKAPFPYFGGKSAVAELVWSRLGADVPNYVEPFFGSGAMLLNRPGWAPETNCIETVNDLSGFISNFWRSVQADPDAVAHHADWIVSESDLHARHGWLVRQAADLSAKMEGDPDYYDARIAGWWVWGACCWIGSGWCSGRGSWQQVEAPDGWRLVDMGATEDGIQRARPHLTGTGQGVNRQLVHLGNAGRGVNRKRVHLLHAGQGVNRSSVHAANGTNAGAGEQGIYAWMNALSARLRRVRVCCGDWSRICGPTPTVENGVTGVFLDPPYAADTGRNMNLYEIDLKHKKNRKLGVGERVYEWCRQNEDNPMLRIALCGYEGEYDLPGWECVAWKAHGGYGSQGDSRGRENADRERIWFSPRCLRPTARIQAGLFDGME